MAKLPSRAQAETHIVRLTPACRRRALQAQNAAYIIQMAPLSPSLVQKSMTLSMNFVLK
jgi:hypothetical protein